MTILPNVVVCDSILRGFLQAFMQCESKVNSRIIRVKKNKMHEIQ